MRILALASEFRTSGKGIAAHQISENLARRGHEVHLQVFDTGHSLERMFREREYKLEIRPSVPLLPSTGLHVLKEVLYLLRSHRNRGYDVALGLDSDDAAALGTAFGKEAGLNVACVLWGNELQEIGRTEAGFIRSSDLLLPVSRLAKTEFIGAGFPEERMKMLPPGVDLDIFRPAESKPKGLGMITVTGLHQDSGVDQLIYVLKEVLDRGHDAWLTVVGKGPERRRLESQARELLVDGAMRILDEVPHRDLGDVMREHKIFVRIPRRLPGRRVPDISLAMMEGAACGLGIVGSDTGGVADSLRMCNGIVAPAEGAERIADVVEKAARRTEMVDTSEETYERMRSWEEVALELESELEELVYE